MKIYRTKFEHIIIIFEYNDDNRKIALNYCFENGYDVTSQGFKGIFYGKRDSTKYIIKAQKKIRNKDKKGGLIKGKGIPMLLIRDDSMLPKDAIEKYEKYLIHMLNETGSIKNGRLPPLHTKTDK